MNPQRFEYLDKAVERGLSDHKKLSDHRQPKWTSNRESRRSLPGGDGVWGTVSDLFPRQFP